MTSSNSRGASNVPLVTRGRDSSASFSCKGLKSPVSSVNASSSCSASRAIDTTLTVGVHFDQPHALRSATDRADIAGRHSQNLPLLTDEHELIFVVHRGHSDDSAVPVRGLDVNNPYTTRDCTISSSSSVLLPYPFSVTVNRVEPGRTTSMATTWSPSRRLMPRTP